MSVQFILEVFEFVVGEYDFYIPRLVQTELQPYIFNDAYNPELYYTAGLVGTSHAKSLYSFVGIDQTPESLLPIDIKRVIGVSPYDVTSPL